ncbi:MAG: NTP transferase domain-containing protein [Ruminococcus sp.]|nr:NTP transferase domain-containing protein [Ruminococcus sp.]
MSASVVILAAGLSTRFEGGVKQLTPVGESGELLMDYSVFDAVHAGFDKVIFIIQRDMEEKIREAAGSRIPKNIKVEYCFQELRDLPSGFGLPENRISPWGTVHAILSARNVINEPFLIINADDYYGKSIYKKMYSFLTNPERKQFEQCMAGFVLKNTLSSTGKVTRGICSFDEKEMLESVTETYRVRRHVSGHIYGDLKDGSTVRLKDTSPVSMNMWGFGQEMIPLLEQRFKDFLSYAEENNVIENAEFPLPDAVDSLIKNGKISVDVIPTRDKWYGMTHKEDIHEIRAAFGDMRRKGYYPVLEKQR